MKPGFLTTLALSGLFGAGCLSNDVRQAYPGDPLPADATCALLVPAMLDVRAIDGVATDWSLRLKSGGVQELRMVPGNHRLLVRYYDPTADESRQELYEVDRIAVFLTANPKSVHELKYDTWTHDPELRKTGEKVRIWVVEIAPGRPAAAPAAAAAPGASVRAATPGSTGGPVVGSDGIDSMKCRWNALTPAERESFRTWLLAQPQR